MTEREHIMPDGPGQSPEAQGPDAGPPIPTPHSPEPVVGPGAPPTPEMGVPSIGAGSGQELGEAPEGAADQRPEEDLPDDIQARLRALEMLDEKEGKDASSLINIANLAKVPKEEFVDLLRAKDYDPAIVEEVINRRDEIRPIEEQVLTEPDVEPLVAEGEEQTAEGEGEEQLPAGEEEPSILDDAKAAIASKDPNIMKKALENLKDKIYNPETGLWGRKGKFKRLVIKPSVMISIVTAIIYISILTWMTSGATKRIGK